MIILLKSNFIIYLHYIYRIVPQNDIIVCHKEIKTAISDLSALKVTISR